MEKSKTPLAQRLWFQLIIVEGIGVMAYILQGVYGRYLFLQMEQRYQRDLLWEIKKQVDDLMGKADGNSPTE